jgi:pimeloyl-ACP methyl ester carboxylesterase
MKRYAEAMRGSPRCYGLRCPTRISANRWYSDSASRPESVALKFKAYNTDIQDKSAPLLFLHGLLGSHGNFNSTAKSQPLSRYAIYSLDLRNHGESPHHENMTFAALAEDIVRFLDSQRLETASLVGHSLGGKVAMATALLHPHRVSKLISGALFEG